MNRIVYSITVFLLSQFLLSCNSCGCKRPDNHVASHFDIQGLNVGFSNKPQYTNEYNTDTLIRNFTITEDSTIIESDNVSLLILFKIKYTAQNLKFNFPLVSCAYACSPKQPGEAGSQEAIDSFYIQAIGSLKFNEFSVDTFFTINRLNSLSLIRNDTIFSFKIFSNNGGIGTNGNNDFISNSKIYFNFTNSISKFTTYGFTRFRVVLKLKNGERYEALTQSIKLI